MLLTHTACTARVGVSPSLTNSTVVQGLEPVQILFFWARVAWAVMTGRAVTVRSLDLWICGWACSDSGALTPSRALHGHDQTSGQDVGPL